MTNKHCEMCGAKTVEYRHVLNRPLAIGLARLGKSDVPTNLKTLGLTRNQWDNFQKLRYWGLVEKAYKNGKRVGGCWKITEKGKLFLLGRLEPKVAWTYRGMTVRLEGDLVGIRDLAPEYRYRQRPEYAADAQPHV